MSETVSEARRSFPIESIAQTAAKRDHADFLQFAQVCSSAVGGSSGVNGSFGVPWERTGKNASRGLFVHLMLGGAVRNPSRPRQRLDVGRLLRHAVRGARPVRLGRAEGGGLFHAEVRQPIGGRCHPPRRRRTNPQRRRGNPSARKPVGEETRRRGNPSAVGKLAHCPEMSSIPAA